MVQRNFGSSPDRRGVSRELVGALRCKAQCLDAALRILSIMKSHTAHTDVHKFYLSYFQTYLDAKVVSGGSRAMAHQVSDKWATKTQRYVAAWDDYNGCTPAHKD